MNDEQQDNIPLLNELIEKGSTSSITPDVTDLEQSIKDIIQKHSSEAVAEILSLIEQKY